MTKEKHQGSGKQDQLQQDKQGAGRTQEGGRSGGQHNPAGQGKSGGSGAEGTQQQSHRQGGGGQHGTSQTGMGQKDKDE